MDPLKILSGMKINQAVAVIRNNVLQLTNVSITILLVLMKKDYKYVPNLYAKENRLFPLLQSRIKSRFVQEKIKQSLS
jgi:hypothetical protein